MKKNILGIVSVFLFFISCSSDSSSEDFTGKVFYGVAIADCNPKSITNLSPDEYVLMSFVDENDNEVSYKPKPNTWYRTSFGGFWVKTGTDVSPKNSPISFDFKSKEYNAPCQ